MRIARKSQWLGRAHSIETRCRGRGKMACFSRVVMLDLDGPTTTSRRCTYPNRCPTRGRTCTRCTSSSPLKSKLSCRGEIFRSLPGNLSAPQSNGLARAARTHWLPKGQRLLPQTPESLGSSIRRSASTMKIKTSRARTQKASLIMSKS